MLSRATALLLVALCCNAVFAQDECLFRISGYVLDEHDRSPLSFAGIVEAGTTHGVIADVDGRYELDGLCPGKVTLVVSHLGCEPDTVRFNVTKDLNYNFFLEHHHEHLKEIQVVADKPDQVLSQDQHELTKEQVDRSAGKSVADMMEAIPGVSTLNTGPTISKPVVHGMYGNRVLVLNNGIRQEDQQWGTEHAPNIDPFGGQEFLLIKGAAAVQYGSDAIGGVVIMEPADLPFGQKVGGHTFLVGESNGRGGTANLMLQGGSRKWKHFAWRGTLTGKYMGDREAPDYVLSNTGIRDLSGSATLGYEKYQWGANVTISSLQTELGILRAAHIGNLTDLENAIERGEPYYIEPFTYEINNPRQQIAHTTARAEAFYRINELDQITALYGWQHNQRKEFDIRRGGRSDRPAVDLDLETHTLDVTYKHFPSKRVRGKVGVSGMLQYNRNIPGTGVRPLIPFYNLWSVGVYLIEQYKLADWELEVGGRYDTRSMEAYKFDQNRELVRTDLTYNNFALTVGGVRKWENGSEMRLNAGTAFRPPNPSELFSEGLHHGAAGIEEGNVDLNAENALKITVAGSIPLFKDKVQLHGTAYFNQMADYIYLEPTGTRLTIRGAFPVFEYKQTDARLYGLDLQLTWNITMKWQYECKAAFVRGWDLDASDWLIYMPSDRVDNSITYTVSKNSTWKFGAASQFVARQVRYPRGVDFADPPGAYHLVNVFAETTIPFGKNYLKVSLSADNLFDTVWRDYLDRFRYYADGMGRNIVLRLKYSFQ